MEDSSNKTSRALHSVAHTIAHPRKTIKRKVKRSTAWGFTPVDQSGISKKKDVELVDAYDDLSRAESKQMLALPRQGAKAAVSRRQERIVTLETERKISQVEWATSHINRVRVVSRSQIQPVKGDSFREWWHGESQIPWKDVIGHVRPQNAVHHSSGLTYPRMSYSLRKSLVHITLMISMSCLSISTR